MKKKVLIVFGTRPEAIKMCPLILELQKSKVLESVVCVTGQHKEMLFPVLETFGVTPDINLEVMRSRQTLTSITNDVLSGMDNVLKKEKPDIVLVHGDTTTSMSAALAAFYEKIPVGHIEAGLRTHNKYSPYPEEMNRVLTSRIAELHFAPTNENREALEAEGIHSGIYVTGNTVIDAFKYTIKKNYKFSCFDLNNIDFSRKIILMTAHRRENLGTPLENICRATLEICENNPDVTVVYPLHMNPAVREIVQPMLRPCPQILLTEPLGVVDLHNLLSRCYMVMTDSGGLQEEAPHLGKPVLVLRIETERPEAVKAGTVRVVGVEKDLIVRQANELLHSKTAYDEMRHAVNPYGDGQASARITTVLETSAQG